MQTREEALQYGLSFPDTYADTPFHDPNWVLVRYKKNKKAFLWTYEHEGRMQINLKVRPEWRDFWRNAFEAVMPGYHQNKEHWNTVILDGSIPDETIQKRLSGRRVCEGCGASYHVDFKPSKEEGKCDKCGGNVVQRKDDHPDTVIERLKVYHDQTAPLKDFYAGRGILETVEGQEDVADTSKLTLKAVGA